MLKPEGMPTTSPWASSTAPGQQQVGDHPGGDHEGPLRQGTVAQQIGIIGRNGAVLVVVGEGHEPTEGNGPQGEEHPAPAPLDQGGAEADREAADPDALPGGGEEVAGLMHQDQPSQDRQCGQDAHSASRFGPDLILRGPTGHRGGNPSAATQLSAAQMGPPPIPCDRSKTPAAVMTQDNPRTGTAGSART